MMTPALETAKTISTIIESHQAAREDRRAWVPRQVPGYRHEDMLLHMVQETQPLYGIHEQNQDWFRLSNISEGFLNTEKPDGAPYPSIPFAQGDARLHLRLIPKTESLDEPFLVDHVEQYGSAATMLLFWLGKHGVLYTTCQRLEETAKQLDTKLDFTRTMRLLRVFMVTSLENAVDEIADAMSGDVPTDWLTPLLVSSVIENLGNTAMLQHVLDNQRANSAV